MKISIHQPNYLPWLGYFHKIALADVFVFLDDVQFSKGSYTNRVKVAGGRWLTLPVRVNLGDSIREVRPSKPNWVRSHLDFLRNTYRHTPFYKTIFQDIEGMYEAVDRESLCETNISLVRAICLCLGINPRFLRSSELNVDARSDERLIEIVRRVDHSGVYISGKGGAKYQDPEKFSSAGLDLQYADFSHPVYPQMSDKFEPGLSIVDAAFHLGWEGVRYFLRRE